MNKTAVYTVLTNGYDTLAPIRPERGFDYFVFTDDSDLNAPGWQPILLEKGDVKKQREIKILAHKYLPDYDTTVYMDANFEVRRHTLTHLLKQFRGGILLIKHQNRRCVYDEAEACKNLGKAKTGEIDKQIFHYKKANFPERFGMWATGFMVRENRPDINEFCETWNQEVQEYTHRDQLAIGYALKKSKVIPQTISHHLLHRYVRLNRHKTTIPKEVKVFYSSPFRSDKNIGKANNDFIELLPDDAWVCITDADAMFLLPDYGKQIEGIIREHGAEYGLIGCITNRLRSLHQCYNNEFSDDMDVRNHYVIARGLRDDYENEVVETTGVAGLCMIFSKKTWLEVGGFKEGCITADTFFNKAVRRKKYKIGLAKGLYVFHGYRIWEKGHLKAANSTAHLR